MADNDIRITFLAEQTQLLAELTKQTNAIQKVSRNWSELGKNANESSASVGSLLERGTSRIAAFGAGVLGVASGLSELVNLSREVYENTDRAAKSLNELQQKFTIQSGLRGVQAEQAQKRILDYALKNAVTPEIANQAAVALASGGFSAEDSSGGALDVALQAIQASLKGSEDPTGLMQSAGQFLAAQGMAKNPENLKRVLVASQQLFKTTDFQITDLTNLASKSQGAAGLMQPEEVLGMFNIMRNKTSADVASTGMKIFMERLQTAKNDPQAKSSLKKLGLKPEDVDFVGENPMQILDRLGAGLDKLPAEKRPLVLEPIFGKEAMSPITGLIRDRALLPQYVKDMGNVAGFNEDVAAATSGKVAADTRLDTQEKIDLANQDTGWERKLKAARKTARGKGESEVGLWFRSNFAKSAAAVGSTVMGRESAESMALHGGFYDVGRTGGLARRVFTPAALYDFFTGGTNGKFEGAAGAYGAGMERPANEQVEILKRIAENTAKPAPVKVVVPPGIPIKPAAAAHDGRRK